MDVQWARDIVAAIATDIGLDPALLELTSCKPNPAFVSGGSSAAASSSSTARQLLQDGSCTNPAYLLEMGVALDPLLDAEEYRWVHSMGVVSGALWRGVSSSSSPA